MFTEVIEKIDAKDKATINHKMINLPAFLFQTLILTRCKAIFKIILVDKAEKLASQIVGDLCTIKFEDII